MALPTSRPSSQLQAMPFPSSADDTPATPTLSELTPTTSSSHDNPWPSAIPAVASTSSSSSAAAAATPSGTRLPPLRKVPVDRKSDAMINEPPTPRSSSERTTSSSQSASRPSSMASSSSSSDGHSSTRHPLSPSILSPSLATALGIGVDQRKNHSLYSSAIASSSSTSLNAVHPSASSTNNVHYPNYRRPPRKSHAGTSSSSGNPKAVSNLPPRRPSLPNVPSMHRISTVSVSSFESLPEHETLPTFLGSPMMAPQSVSRQSSTRSRSSDAQPDSPGLGSNLMLPPASLPHHRDAEPMPSPPCSPTTPFAAASNARNPNSRPAMLQRAQTEPSNGASNLSTKERMRKRGLIAKELLTTEHAYVECLQVIKDCFYEPLRARCGGLKGSPDPAAGPIILSRKALTDIFSNFIDIFHLNTELLAQLDSRLKGPLPDRLQDSSLKRTDSAVNELSGSSSTPADNTTPSPPSSALRWGPEAGTIGDILVPIAPFLKMYSLFVKNFSSALNRIESERKENDAFARFLKETEKSTWGRGKGFFGLGLQAHLLSIVQRIPRYKLLVGDLLKNTPQHHRDHSDLQKAFDMIEQVASTINENVRQHEMVMLMLAIQRSLLGVTTPLVVPGRSLVKRGTLMKACRKDIQARAFFLFSDCLVYARPASGGGPAAIEAAWAAIARAGGISSTGPLAKLNGQPQSFAFSRRGSWDHNGAATPDLYAPRVRASSGNLFSANAILDALQTQQAPQLQYRELIALQDCTVIGIEDNALSHSIAGVIEAGGTPFGFEIRTPDKSFTVYAESAESREAWLDAIREARNDWLQDRRTLQAEEDSILARRDRRRSVAAASAAAKARQSVYSLHSPPPAITVTPGKDLPSGVASSDTSATSPGEPPLMRPTSLSSLPATASFAALLSAAGAPNMPSGPLRVLEDYNAPAWVPDSRADRCMSCSEAFGVFRRKHHCRLCGRVVCWSCSTQKFIIASYDESKEDAVARACDSCYESTFPPLSPTEGDCVGEDSFAGLEVNEDAPASATNVVDASAAASPTNQIHFPTEDSKERTPRPHVVRFQSRESSVENDDPVTPGDGQELPSDSGDFTLTSAEPTTGTDHTPTTHVKNLTAPLKALALEGGPLSAPCHLDSAPTRHHDQAGVLREGRWNGRLPARFPSKIAGNDRSQSDARAAFARMSTTTSLAPHVHAATSGSGTFRLAPPRVTTPESENGPITRLFEGYGHRNGLMGAEGSYFAGAVIPEDSVVTCDSAPEVEIKPASAQRSNASPPRPKGHVSRHSLGGGPIAGLALTPPTGRSSPFGDGDVSLARHRSRKKPMSAAARLSTYYGNSLAGSPAPVAGSNSAGTATPGHAQPRI